MKRIEYIDRARAIGMFLVYYGHFVEKVVAVKSRSAFSAQWRFIYSFHVPLFFFLAGVFWKPSVDFRAALKAGLKTRIVPWVFFSLLLLPLWLIFAPAQLWEALSSFPYLTGIPQLNIVTWFLICLAVVELLAAMIGKYLKVTSLRLAVYSVILLFIGYYGFIGNAPRVSVWTGVRPNIWYIDDAFMAIPFYFAGYLLRDVLVWLEGRWGWAFAVVIAAAAGYGLLHTYDLNEGEKFWGVLMVASKYGKLPFFLLNAFLGIFCVIALSRALRFNLPPLNFVARNSLIYMGLNGLCYHFLNTVIVENLKLPVNSYFTLTVYATVVTLATMLLFAPLVVALRCWIPEMVGMMWTETSLLPPIDTWHASGPGRWFLAQTKKYIIN